MGKPSTLHGSPCPSHFRSALEPAANLRQSTVQPPVRPAKSTFPVPSSPRLALSHRWQPARTDRQGRREFLESSTSTRIPSPKGGIGVLGGRRPTQQALNAPLQAKISKHPDTARRDFTVHGDPSCHRLPCHHPLAFLSIPSLFYIPYHQARLQRLQRIREP